MENKKFNSKIKSNNQSNAQDSVLVIEKMGNDLEGVCYQNGKRCLVNGAITGEKVVVTNPQISGSVTIYQLKQILNPSPFRVKCACKYNKDCGACTLMSIKYEHQLKLKTDMIKRRFNEWRDIVGDTIGTTDKRNKIQLAFRGAGENMQVGFFSSETHKVVDIENCIMHNTRVFKCIRAALLNWCAKYNIIAYNPHRQRGNLRFAVIRFLGNSVLLSLVFFKNSGIDGLCYLYSLLKKDFDFVSINININSQISNAVFDGTPTHFIGEKEIVGNLLGIDFAYRAGDFLQTNLEICSKIYFDVLQQLKASTVNRIIDAYSGIGITSSLFVKNGFEVVSVEISSDAVETAKRTATINKADGHIEFFAGDFAKIIKNITITPQTAIFVDPPRAGLGKTVCESLLSSGIGTIVYLSCEPKTLLADLTILKQNYTVTKIQPYDMFANTKHVETLVVLSK